MTAMRTSGAMDAPRAGSILALVTLFAFLLLLVGGTTASAADAVFPGGPKTLVIHPGIEAGPANTRGTGLPPAAGEPAGIAGHAYEVKRVPGLRLEKTVDWNRAVEMTPAEAAPLVADQPAETGATSPDESIVFEGLADGLYLITETAAPAGAIRAKPFLVALPLPDPANAEAWLTTVHVYPKTASVLVGLGVRDAAAVTCGDPVSWTSLSAIPEVDQLSSYRVQHLLAVGVTLRGTAADTSVEITGQPALRAGADYTVEETRVDGRVAIETQFTEAGITKLLVDTGAEVRISFESAVSAPGEFVNEVRLFAGDAGVVTDTATTKFGPLRILVHEKGHPNNLIEDAEFRLYTSEAAARGGNGAVGFAAGADLRTDADGLITVECLRYSNHADGLDRAPGSELYRDYFAKPVSYPAGWTGEDVILRGGVTSATEPETLRAVVWKNASVIPPIPVLSETGGRITAALLLGGVLIGAGALVAARRRREQRGT
ncbi:SpaH/EbpB family LPXTG-anchored major pilin [Leucobacter komagatae]|uniref:Gram-positive pilin subunit D1 N-terminal domain-containing protein n=1 Tax=Leucobacter komagatae TaxID=55969 RepID=A0A0D0H4Q9_9MICO|nr:SpaH/EbpB family LPXTG-anchored major pilin [Leucobacter komagatae]KIP52095.1 hypothetical protein SD72_11095 [Leucobacter komagatae]